MAQINLLPWREELRKRRQKEFGVSAAIAVGLMLCVVGGVHLHYQDRIEYQQSRNKYLDTQIQQLDKRIKEIGDLKNQRERLLARTEKIQQLQSGRPEIVHLVDEMVKTLPEGVYYTKVTQKGSNLALEGVAQSNARVSSLMRQLDSSAWLQDPKLLQIVAAGKATAATAIRNSQFRLNIKQTRKTAPKQEGSGKKPAKKRKSNKS
jgi:type IV pilus assembly protein PilN